MRVINKCPTCGDAHFGKGMCKRCREAGKEWIDKFVDLVKRAKEWRKAREGSAGKAGGNEGKN